MNNTKICVNKQASYIALFMMIILGYAIFSMTMLQKKQVTNSKAAATNAKPVASITSYPPQCYTESDKTSKPICLSPQYEKYKYLTLTLTKDQYDSLKAYKEGDVNNSRAFIVGSFYTSSDQIYKQVAAVNTADMDKLIHIKSIYLGTSHKKAPSPTPIPPTAQYAYISVTLAPADVYKHSFVLFVAPKDPVTPRTCVQPNTLIGACSVIRSD